jgi:hypothetical protein
MFYWYDNKEVKRKKMKKIAIAVGIIACLAVLSLLLTSASAQEEDWMGCPGGWGDQNSTWSLVDPTRVHYEKYIVGAGYEDSRARLATHTWNAGLGGSTSSRGSAFIEDYQSFDVDTNPTDPRLNIISQVDKTYAEVTFGDRLVKPLNRSLGGETCVKSYLTGDMVSERYMDTYDIAGTFNHTGNATYSSTTIDRYIYGTSRFAVTVKEPTDFKHTIMRVREEHTGEFEMQRNVTVRRYGTP